MRAELILGLLLSAIAAPSCGSAGAGGGCAEPLGTDCSFSPNAPAAFCPLDTGVVSACEPCGPLDGGHSCAFRGALVHGSKYTYIQLMNVDVADVLVYDESGALIAKLRWAANIPTNYGWACNAGPRDFDMREAMSLLPVIGPGELSCPTAAR